MDTSIIITHAKVITADPAQPRAEALAVVGNKIVGVGLESDIRSLAPHTASCIDAQGCTLLPGFIDSHYHLAMGSAELDNAALDDVNSLDDLQAAILQYAQHHLDTEWIGGSHLKYSILPGDQRLTRQHLDAILPDRPLALMAYDYHTLWANTRALELAQILQPPSNGMDSGIVLGPDGLAGGELREPGAYGPVLALTGVWGRAAGSLLGNPSQDTCSEDLAQDRALIHKGLVLTAQHGITSIHNMDGNYGQMAFYAALEEQGELTTRLYVPLSVLPETPLEALQEAVKMRLDHHSTMLHAGLVKFFMDGVVESWTAALLDDYADLPGVQGSALYDLEHFIEMATECDRLGLQISVHAIGDAAVRRTLDGFEAVQRLNGKRDSRHRIEHIEIVHPDDLPRFANLGVIASMQPYHLPGAAGGDDIWMPRAGENRWERSFAWQYLRQAGACLVFGSDWPVVTSNPMLALQTALTRKAWKPGLPNHRQTLEDSIASYTRLAAYAEFQEHLKGQLRPGMLADMVLLSADLEQTAPQEYAQTHPVLTICDGRIVYQA